MRTGKHLLSWAILFVTATLFVTVFSTTTGPNSPGYGRDSAAFRLFGHAMTEGLRPYIDIWDHKGPGLYLIQWLGQIIFPGRIGIFILQILFLFGTLVCIDLIAKKFLSIPLRTVVAAAALTLLAVTYEGGNFTEEYSVFFIALPLAILTREWLTGKKLHPIFFAVAGASLAYVAFIRVNNALPAIAVFVAYFVVALVRRQKFWIPLVSSLLGFFVVAGAFIAWFAAAGSLGEMLNATITFNSLYSKSREYDPNVLIAQGYVFVALFALGVCLVGGIVDRQLHRRWEFFILSWGLAAFTALPLFMTANGYFHYIQLAVPALALGLILGLQSVTQRSVTATIAATVVLLLPVLGIYGLRASHYAERVYEAPYYAESQSIMEPIPENQRDEVYAWNVEPKFFLINDLLPLQRFYFFQDFWGNIDPRISREVADFVSQEHPRWIVTSAQEIGNSEVAETVATEYSLVKENQRFKLYELTP